MVGRVLLCGTLGVRGARRSSQWDNLSGWHAGHQGTRDLAIQDYGNALDAGARPRSGWSSGWQRGVGDGHLCLDVSVSVGLEG